MSKPIETLLQKEMTRKEFLGTLGLGLASLLGFSSVIRLLNNKGKAQQSQVSGYGSSSYGK
ncbi:MAG TPA: hypothetical protein VLH38_04025 [Patescibacteria group bacterium]|nr:hypothetical protein [Patescibacteria group bacterium]